MTPRFGSFLVISGAGNSDPALSLVGRFFNK